MKGPGPKPANACTASSQGTSPPLHPVQDQQHDHRADNADDKRAQPPCRLEADEREQEVADDAPDDADQDHADDPARRPPWHDGAGDSAADQADNYRADDSTHRMVSFVRRPESWTCTRPFPSVHCASNRVSNGRV